MKMCNGDRLDGVQVAAIEDRRVPVRRTTILTIAKNNRAIELFSVVALGTILIGVLELCQTGTAVVLRTTSTLLVSKVLTSPRCEKT
jgi:hypothetical protein